MKAVAAMLLALALAGCAGNSLLRPGEPQATATPAQPQSFRPQAGLNPLVIPPQETHHPAGPGAEKELDYETLEGPGMTDPDAPPEPEVPAPESAAVEKAKEPPPKPIEPPKPGQVAINAVAVTTVKGSPGKGNQELTLSMRNILKSAGWPVISSPRKDALTVRGKVELGKPFEGKQMVRLSWVVEDPSGAVLGDLKQENVVEAGSLDQGWGETADAATQAAAEGLFKLIEKHR